MSLVVVTFCYHSLIKYLFIPTIGTNTGSGNTVSKTDKVPPSLSLLSNGEKTMNKQIHTKKIHSYAHTHMHNTHTYSDHGKCYDARKPE